jgi:hypothetical protein
VVISGLSFRDGMALVCNEGASDLYLVGCDVCVVVVGCASIVVVGRELCKTEGLAAGSSDATGDGSF